jgi:hypothetical protein
METHSNLAQLFQNLTRWRHLPNYQLERRADALFALYLPDLVQERVGRPVSRVIVPELPILCSLIWPEREGMKSVKADYLLLAEDRSEAYLVELKTDAGSRDDRQDEYLTKACESGCGLKTVIEGVIAIARASASRAKYASLLQLLAEAGLVNVPTTGPVSAAWFNAVTVLDVPPVLKAIYVQPDAGNVGETVIDFATVAAHVSRFDDELSKLFAEHLKRWTERPGYTRPDDLL